MSLRLRSIVVSLVCTAACSSGGSGSSAQHDATTCAQAALAPSSIGCEFWAVDLDQQDLLSDPASAAWGVAISNPGTAPAAVTITRNDAVPAETPQPAVVTTVTVAPGATEVLTLATRELDCGSTPNDFHSPGTCLSSRAYRVTSSVPVAVRQLNALANTYSNDASLLLPTAALGRSYRVLGWQPSYPMPISAPGTLLHGFVTRAYVTVVGTEPGTQVTVRTAWRTRGNGPVPASAAGGTITVTLGAYDVLNLETDDATPAELAAATTVADLSGTSVTASAPVAVFTGVEAALAPGPFTVPTYPGWDPGSTCCSDHLEEQLLPLEALGTRYVVPRSPVRSTGTWHEPDVLRFVGGAEQAQVTTSLPPPFDAFTLGAGEVRTTSTQVAAVVSSDRPIVVGQVLVSGGYVEGTANGDPSLVILTPVEQALSGYVLFAPATWTSSWVVVTAPVGSPVTLDGLDPVGCSAEPAGTLDGTAWESRACPISVGAHRLQGATPFGAVQYGYAATASYGLVAGTGAARRYAPPPL